MEREEDPGPPPVVMYGSVKSRNESIVSVRKQKKSTVARLGMVMRKSFWTGPAPSTVAAW